MQKTCEDIVVIDAELPKELALNPLGQISGSMDCPGDDCNGDEGGCPSDASCGQDC